MLQIRHNEDGTYQIGDPRVPESIPSRWGRRMTEDELKDLVVISLATLFSEQSFKALILGLDIMQGRDDVRK